MAKEPKTDSVVHHEDRHAKIKTESAAAAERQAEDQEIARSGVAVRVDETREDLLNRIRKMREEAANPPPMDQGGYMSDGQKQQLSAEQEAGRAAVAKAEQEAEANRKSAERIEGEKNRA
jgi:hypothetical protein